MNNERIRAFAAVPTPPDVADAMENFILRLSSTARLKWVKREQLHITLRFIGERSPEVVARIKRALAPIEIKPFSVELNKIGAFPNFSRPRVLWLGCERGAEELTSLAEKINDALYSVGVERDRRPFVPHLTIARSDGAALPSSLASSLKKIPSFSWRCGSFVLMRSRLTPRGAIYSVMDIERTD